MRVAAGDAPRALRGSGTVVNYGPGTVFFGDDQFVSPDSADGQLGAGQSTVINGTLWFVASGVADVFVAPTAGAVSPGGELYAPRALAPTTAARETVVSTFQAGHGFAKGSAAGTQTDDTAEYRLGSQALRMVTAGDGVVAFTQKVNLSPVVDMTGRFLKVMVRVDDYTRAKELSVYLSSETPSVAWTNFVKCGVIPTTVPSTPWVTSGDWLTVTLSRGDFTATGTGVTWNAITGIRVRFADQATGPLTAHINLISTVPEPATGIVSLTWDDGWLSQYTLGRLKQDQYRYGATAYLIADYIDQKPGYMTSAQLRELRDLHDWEVASHAGTGLVHDARFTSVAGNALEDDMVTLKRFLLTGGYRAGDHIAYPGGQYDTATVLPIMRRYFTTGRTIFKSNASGIATSETYPPADWHRLRAWSLNGTTAAVSTDGPAAVNAAIDHAAANKEWLILCFHKLVAARSIPEASTEYLTADFASVVDKIAGTAGVVCKTVGDVVRSGAA